MVRLRELEYSSRKGKWSLWTNHTHSTTVYGIQSFCIQSLGFVFRILGRLFGVFGDWKHKTSPIFCIQIFYTQSFTPKSVISNILHLTFYIQSFMSNHLHPIFYIQSLASNLSLHDHLHLIFSIVTEGAGSATHTKL